MAPRRPCAAVRAATTKKTKDEFPQLAPLGLRIEKTKGRGMYQLLIFYLFNVITDFLSGNCLFHAASMQMYGTDQRHAVIRAQTSTSPNPKPSINPALFHH